MTDHSEASLRSALPIRHPNIPPPPHAVSSSGLTFAPPWQQHLPRYPPVHAQAWQPGPTQRKPGLDTVIGAVFGPARRPDREWAFVRPHSSRQKPQPYRASSEETIDIPRPFPIPTTKQHSTRIDCAVKRSDESPHHASKRQPRSTSPPARRREYHVRDRRRRSSLGAQLDGPASSDNNSRRGQSRTKWRDVTHTYSYKHFCAICGKSRSASYHKEHPWGPGIRAKAGVCRRCTPSRPWEAEPSEPSELCTPPPLREEIISESESEEIIVRHSAKKKQADSVKAAKTSKAQSRKDSMSPARTSQPTKRRSATQRPGTPNSFTTFAAEPEYGTAQPDPEQDNNNPRIVRRLVYRYVPDLERMESRRERNNKTEIVIEEMPAGRDTAQVLASRPGAWSRGRMIQVDQDVEEEFVTLSSSEEEKSKSIDQPEWYFRRVTRRTAPMAFRDYDARPHPPRHIDHDDTARDDNNSRPTRRPLRSILQPVAPLPRRDRQYDDDWADEDYTSYNDQQSRVSFAPGTKQGRRGTAVPCTPAPPRERLTERLGKEALRDSVEAAGDAREERRIKSRARREMAKDGGAYMELDGHYSDDQEGVKSVEKELVRPDPSPIRVCFSSASPCTPRSASNPLMALPRARSPPPSPRSISQNANIKRHTPKFTCASLFTDDPVGVPTGVRPAPASIFSSRSNSRESSSEFTTQNRSPRPALRGRRQSSGLVPVDYRRQQQTSPAPPENSPASPPTSPAPVRPQLSRIRRLSKKSSSEVRQRSLSPRRRREPSSPRLGRLSFTPPGSPLPRSDSEDIFWAHSTPGGTMDEKAAMGKEEMANVGRPRVKRVASDRAPSALMHEMGDGPREELSTPPEPRRISL